MPSSISGCSVSEISDFIEPILDSPVHAIVPFAPGGSKNFNRNIPANSGSSFVCWAPQIGNADFGVPDRFPPPIVKLSNVANQAFSGLLPNFPPQFIAVTPTEFGVMPARAAASRLIIDVGAPLSIRAVISCPLMWTGCYYLPRILRRQITTSGTEDALSSQ